MAGSLAVRLLVLAASLLVTAGRGVPSGSESSSPDGVFTLPHATTTSPYVHQRPWFAQLESLLNQIRSEDVVLPPPRALPEPYTAAPDAEDDYSYEDDEEDDDYDFDEDVSENEDPLEETHLSSWDHLQSQQPREMSSVSQNKWRTMGTRSGVDDLRRARIASGAAKSLSAMPGYVEAVDHLLRVNRDGDCKVPKPRLVQVKHEYPHPSKIYLPRCTILHQCGDDTGCCNAESLTCVPRQAHRVDLFFYTSTVGTGPGSIQRIERLSFFNHTECGCEDRNSEILDRDRSHSVRSMNRGLFQAPQPRAERAPQSLTSCRCPSKYAVRQGHEGSCACDCFDKHGECLRLKRGKEYFNTQDRQCIQKGECKVPTCEFGSYLRLAGRCTKKRERFEAWNQ